MYGLTRAAVVAAPSGEAITTAEARKQCDIVGSDHDTYLDALITAARQKWERDTDRIVMQCTVVEKRDDWGNEIIELTRSPVQSITSIYYFDANQNNTLLASSQYVLDTHLPRPSIYPAYDIDWPTLRGWPGDITITYVAGYSSAANVPQIWKQAMLMLIGHWFETRSTVAFGASPTEVPQGYERIVENYRRASYP